MTTKAWRIEAAGAASIARLAQLHAEALPDDFLPSLGRDFLERVYYPAALHSVFGTTMVVTEAGDPFGFVTVAHDADRFIGDVIRQALLSTSYYLARRCVRRPRTVLEILALAGATMSPADRVRGEIVFIAVDAAHRGAGVGTALVRAALAYLSGRCVEQCRTKTLAANAGVIGMYRRLGWNVREHYWLMGREYATIVSPPIDGVAQAVSVEPVQ